MFGLFGSKSPLATNEQAWVERRMLWLIGRFGVDRLRNAKVILPTDEFWPEPYTYDEVSAQKCMQRMCGYMGVDPAAVTLAFIDDDDMPGAAGLYQMRSRSEICIARGQLAAPPRLLATLAHELAHEILLKGGHLTQETPDHEQVTDLLPVFLGTGIFLANGTVESSSYSDAHWSYFSISKQGYLNSIVLGYALGLFAYLRNEQSPEWACHLRTDAAETLWACLRYLQDCDGSLLHHKWLEGATARTTVQEIATDLQHRSAVIRCSALSDMIDCAMFPAELLPAVELCLRDRDQHVQRQAYIVLGEFGDRIAPLTARLIETACHGKAYVRTAACHTLSRIPSAVEHAVPALIENLEGAEADVVCASALALQALGRKAESAESQLLAAIEAAAAVTDYDRLNCLIPALRAVVADVKASLKSYLTDRDPQVRLLVFGILKDLERAER